MDVGLFLLLLGSVIHSQILGQLTAMKKPSLYVNQLETAYYYTRNCLLLVFVNNKRHIQSN